MLKFFTTSLGLFRVLAFTEGVSFLVLLFIAMPFKYLLGEPILVRVIGMAHGFLFVALILATILIAADKGWSKVLVVKILLSSLLPFGTFYIDKKELSKLE
jgi:integral membrane protein